MNIVSNLVFKNGVGLWWVLVLSSEVPLCLTLSDISSFQSVNFTTQERVKHQLLHQGKQTHNNEREREKRTTYKFRNGHQSSQFFSIHILIAYTLVSNDTVWEAPFQLGQQILSQIHIIMYNVSTQKLIVQTTPKSKRGGKKDTQKIVSHQKNHIITDFMKLQLRFASQICKFIKKRGNFLCPCTYISFFPQWNKTHC